MPKYLIVPVKLDVLAIGTNGLNVAGPSLDFTNLPWEKHETVGGAEHIIEHNKTSPYLHDTVARQSLGNYALHKGLHFHWTLPFALTKTMNVPIVYKQSFTLVFGEGKGEKIWQALQDKNMIELLPGQPAAAKVILLDTPDFDRSDASNTLQENWYDIHKQLRGLNFPAVPNRWLVSRPSRNKQTLVESDYLWPEGAQRPPDTTSVFPQFSEDKAIQPYRYIGRSYDPDQAPQGGEYLSDPLTAAGYGDPNFAAYYPDCQTVFGLYDEELPTSTEEVFELLGWYDNPEQDYFKTFVNHYINQWYKDHDPAQAMVAGAKNQYLYLDLLYTIYNRLLLEIPIKANQNDLDNLNNTTLSDSNEKAGVALIKAGWLDANGTMLPKAYDPQTVLNGADSTQTAAILNILNGLVGAQFPDQIILYARSIGAEDGNQEITKPAAFKISVGNSPSEALSALLAQSIAPTQKSIVEDQLESIQFASKLASVAVDTGPLFESLRHEKQFTAIEGGRIWEIRTKQEAAQQAGQTGEAPPPVLPPDLAEALNQLNLQEEDYDLNGAAIGSIRRQIYTDWCLFLEMEAAVSYRIANPPSPDPGGQDGSGGQDDSGGQGDGTFAIDVAKSHLNNFKAFILNEISKDDEQHGILQECLKQDAKLKNDISSKLLMVQKMLQEYQYNIQFVWDLDIPDWPVFITNLKKVQLKDSIPNWWTTFITALNNIKVTDWANNSSPDNRAECLLLLNNTLKGLNAPFPFPENIKPENKPVEATALEEQLSKLGNSATEQQLKKSIVLRLSRLALEAHLGAALKHRPRYELQAQPADRYWRPNDPAVYISDLNPAPRYEGIDKAVKTVLVPIGGTPGQPPSVTDLNAIAGKARPTIPEAQETVKSWHPLFLHWSAMVQLPKLDHGNYGVDYLNNYALGTNDLSIKESGEVTYSDALGFSGMTVLMPGARLQFNKTIASRLTPFILDIYKEMGQPDELTKFDNWFNGLTGTDKEPFITDPDQLPQDQITAWIQTTLGEHTAHATVLINGVASKLLSKDSKLPIIGQFCTDKNLEGGISEANLDTFLEWAEPRIHLKASFYAEKKLAGKNTLLDTPLDILLMDDQTVLNGFITWLIPMLGASLNRYADHDVPKPIDFLKANYENVIQWFQPQVDKALHLVVEIMAYQKLSELGGLSQSLGGFGQAMIQRHQGFQLPIRRPFPIDPKDTSFAQIVRDAVLGAGHTGPDTSQPFAPLRAGNMHLDTLAMLDNFGRRLTILDTNNTDKTDGTYYKTHENDKNIAPVTADTLPAFKDKFGWIQLPPRFIQPARLNFHWLSASQGTEEMNDRPASSPVCGWVLPNNLDDSLMVYSADGAALGYLNEAGAWSPFPGITGMDSLDTIPNKHLAQMVKWLRAKHLEDPSLKPNFLASFLSVLNEAQENMEPEQFAQQEAMALLIGAPLALVRADVHLNLRELPATMYHADDARKVPDLSSSRVTLDFENVITHLRLGEHNRLNDGLAGYWEEGPNRDTFYAPQTHTDSTPKYIVTRKAADNDILLEMTMGQKITVSMLIDPRMPIHATAGLLPTKAIQLPPDQYMPALKRLQVAFMTTPLLTPLENLQISLPKEAGFEWSWIQQQGINWSEINTQGIVTKGQLAELLGIDIDQIWETLKLQQWLTALANGNAARIAPKGQRLDLPGIDASLKEKIDAALNRLSVAPFDPAPRFNLTQVLREGWLRLTPEA